jgi:hypothetical protein
MLALAFPAHALTEGDYTYTTNATGQATITGFNKNHTGALAITNSLGGCPVTGIGRGAFFHCTGLTSVTIPASVTNIGRAAFVNCFALTAISVDPLNSFYSSQDGVLFDKGKTTLICYPAHKAGRYTIPASVTTIGTAAFQYCKRLTSVTIPASVTNIQNSAFFATGPRVTFLGNAPMIGEAVFNRYSVTVNCYPGTTGFTSPAWQQYRVVTVLPLGEYTYTTNAAGEATITGFNESYTGDLVITNTLGGCPVTGIGDTHVGVGGEFDRIRAKAFSGCTGLTSVTIPSSVTSIGIYAFSGCTNLTSVTLGASVTSIGDHAFFGKTAFSGCDRLTTITVDATNASYSSTDGVLFDKGQSTLVYYPSGKLGSYAIPSKVATIGMAAFRDSTRLTNVTIPSSVTFISNWAFQGCTGLTDLTIPNSVNFVADGAFQDCTSLTNVTISPGLTNIGTTAFQNCTNLPASFRTSPPMTNSGCIYTVQYGRATITGFDPSSVGALSITNSLGGCRVTTISYNPFFQCAGLTSVTIPASVTTIQSGFGECTGLKAFIVDAANPNYSSLAGVLFDKGQTVLIAYPKAKVGSYVIPSNVTAIGPGAFSGCRELSSVTIPASVSTIGNVAFSGCTSLTNITIPASLTNVGYHAFENCTNLPVAIQNLAPKAPPPHLIPPGTIRRQPFGPPQSPQTGTNASPNPAAAPDAGK